MAGSILLLDQPPLGVYNGCGLFYFAILLQLGLSAVFGTGSFTSLLWLRNYNLTRSHRNSLLCLKSSMMLLILQLLQFVELSLNAFYATVTLTVPSESKET